MVKTSSESDHVPSHVPGWSPGRYVTGTAGQTEYGAVTAAYRTQVASLARNDRITVFPSIIRK